MEIVRSTKNIPPRAKVCLQKGRAAAAQLLKQQLIRRHGNSLGNILDHFHLSGNSNKLSCKYYDAPLCIGAKTLGHLGQKVSPIVLGTLKDLKFYDVCGIPEDIRHLEDNIKRRESDDPWYRPGGNRWDQLSPMEQFFCEKIVVHGPRTAMPFLKDYLLIPTASGKLVFICDDHTHAAFGWALAREAGILKKPPALIHIDEHSDNRIKSYIPSRPKNKVLQDLAKFMWSSLDIANFIDLAARYRLDAKGTIIDPYEIFFVLSGHNNRGLFEPTNYWNSGIFPGLSLVDGHDVSMERAGEAFARVREKNKPVICDIDLDYFYQHFTPDGPKRNYGFTFEEALQRVIEVAKRSDFITIATSPNYLLVKNPKEVTSFLLSEIVRELDNSNIW